MKRLTEIKYYRCPLCSAVWEYEVDAQRCLNSHVSVEKLSIVGHTKIYGEEGVYRPGEPFPNALMVQDEEGNRMRYLIYQPTRSNSTRPLRRGHIRLHDDQASKFKAEPGLPEDPTPDIEERTDQ